MYQTYMEERLEAFRAMRQMESDVLAISRKIVDCVKDGHKIITCGNGGSAAEAQHFSTELVGRFKSNRPSLPALSLNADGSAITCIANDFGADFVFARQLEGLGMAGDLLVVLSSSGNSTNIIKALQAAQVKGIESIALLGKGGGQCRGMATKELIVPSDSTAVVQELHLFLVHFICEQVEKNYT